MSDQQDLGVLVEYAITLPKTLYQHLETLATQHHTSLDQTIVEALVAYVEQQAEADTDEFILQSIVQGWHEARQDVAGRSIHDILAEMDDD